MTAEQTALVGKAHRSLEAARLLHSHGQAEFAVGRAYYAMFYAAKALLLGDGLTFSRHSALISAFGERFSKPGRLPAHLHRYLIRAAEVRHLGDYTTGSVSDDEIEEQIRRAEEFLAAAEQLLRAAP